MPNKIRQPWYVRFIWHSLLTTSHSVCADWLLCELIPGSVNRFLPANRASSSPDERRPEAGNETRHYILLTGLGDVWTGGTSCVYMHVFGCVQPSCYCLNTYLKQIRESGSKRKCHEKRVYYIVFISWSTSNTRFVVTKTTIHLNVLSFNN